jgi:hypothetical protein
MSAESCASLRRLPSLGRCLARRLEAGGVEAGADEAVDGILGPGVVGGLRQRRRLRRDERPMRLPRRALLDPAAHERDLVRPQFLMRLRRGHDFVDVRGGDAEIKTALVRLALDDGRRFLLALLVDARREEARFGVKAQAGFARPGVRAVAVEAVVGEQGTDVAIEGGAVGREGRTSEEGQERKEGLTHGKGVWVR